MTAVEQTHNACTRHLNFTAFWTVVLPGLKTWMDLRSFWTHHTHRPTAFAEDWHYWSNTWSSLRDISEVKSSLSEVSVLSITEGSKSADWRDGSNTTSKIANIVAVYASQNIVNPPQCTYTLHLGNTHMHKASMVGISDLQRGRGLTKSRVQLLFKILNDSFFQGRWLWLGTVRQVYASPETLMCFCFSGNRRKKTLWPMMDLFFCALIFSFPFPFNLIYLYFSTFCFGLLGFSQLAIHLILMQFMK